MKIEPGKLWALGLQWSGRLSCKEDNRWDHSPQSPSSNDISSCGSKVGSLRSDRSQCRFESCQLDLRAPRYKVVNHLLAKMGSLCGLVSRNIAHPKKVNDPAPISVAVFLD